MFGVILNSANCLILSFINDKKFAYIMYELDLKLHIYFMLEKCDKIMHFCFNFDTSKYQHASLVQSRLPPSEVARERHSVLTCSGVRFVDPWPSVVTRRWASATACTHYFATIHPVIKDTGQSFNLLILQKHTPFKVSFKVNHYTGTTISSLPSKNKT